MHIVNKHGVVHTVPDDWALPAGARKASKTEIEQYEKAKAAQQSANLKRVRAEQAQAAAGLLNAAGAIEGLAANEPAEEQKAKSPKDVEPQKDAKADAKS